MRAALAAGLLMVIGAAATGALADPSVIAPLAARSLLLDVAAAGDRLVAVGERGHVLLSDDSGETWRQVPAPTRTTLTAVHFRDPVTGWAAGHDAVILRTTDAGETWEQVFADPEIEAPLLDIGSTDEAKVIAIGAYGLMLVSADDGRTFERARVNPDDDFHLNRLDRVAADSGHDALLIAAEAGFAYRSEDGGETWETLDSPYEGSFFGLLPLSDGALLMFGLRGHLFRSEDAGDTWTAIDAGTTAILTDAVELADGRVVVTGLEGVVLVSTDTGRSFRLSRQPERLGVAALAQAPDGTLVTVGEGGARRLDVGP